MLSERITDCQVQKFFHGSYEIDATDDYSHINYGQASVTMSDVRQTLTEQIRLHHKFAKDYEAPEDSSINSFEEEMESELKEMEELLQEATVSLARIYMKQGCVYAKLANHETALVCQSI